MTPWYELPSGASVTAWQAFTVTDIVVGVAAVGAVAFASASLARLSVSLPVAGSALTASLGLIAFMLILYRVINPADDLQRQLGIWLGLLAAAGVTAGGWIGMGEGDTQAAQ